MAISVLKRLLIGGAAISSRPAHVGLAVLRIYVGLALAAAHGLAKMPPSAPFIDGVSSMGLPAPTFFAWAAACSELVGGLLLALGLFTRPAALFILITMSTAAFVAHSADPFAKKELALTYAAVALLFVLVGSGRLGVDALLRRTFGA